MKDTTLLDKLIVGRVEPHIYAFTTNTIPNYLKVGDTYRPVAVRLQEWREYFPDLQKEYDRIAKVCNEIYFRDFAVHLFLEQEKHCSRLLPTDLAQGIHYSREFFKEATAQDVSEAVEDIQQSFTENDNRYQFYNVATSLPETHTYRRTETYPPRPNQEKTIKQFKAAIDSGRTNLLMYAVMRFGKSFTSMCCALEMNANIVVVVSAKADVKEEWKKTVQSHVRFIDYDFLTGDQLLANENAIKEKLEASRKVVVFLTLQDLQGDTIKDKHREIFGRDIDLLIIDETHFGARAEKYGRVLRTEGKQHSRDTDDFVEAADAEEQMKFLSTRIKLHLSGTPYRILMGSEFSKEDIIAFYQFSDIVKDQEAWIRENNEKDEPKEEWENPYYGFPQMIRFAFDPNESSSRRLKELRENGVSYAFSALLKPKSIRKVDDGSHTQFVFEQEILDLLSVIDGSKDDDSLLGFLDYEKIKSGNMCRHIVCVLPYCASCDAMEALIRSHAEQFRNLNDYEIINISGVERPNEYKSPIEIKKKINDCEKNGKKTLTLTVNRMLTGSTVEQWDTMLFLKDTASPQEYDQAIFRLQNQFIKEYEDNEGHVIKYNMKPQTLLVDFMPGRMFRMQEQKSQIYNVNVDEAGNSRLEERIREELRISPIIVMNNDKMEQVQATDILQAVSAYSKTRGVAEETAEIPVDVDLLKIDLIRSAIEQENELGSKAGFSTKAHEGDGEGSDLDIPEGGEDTGAGDVPGTTPTEGQETGTPADTEQNEKKKDQIKQFRSYYARILFFAFLTRDTVISLEEIITKMDAPENARIARNIGISKPILLAILQNINKFILPKLDYKIHNLNKLSHDESVDPIERAAVAVQKFGKLGESEVITPRNICKDMIELIPDEGLVNAIQNRHKILDIAGKAGEFALAVYERLIQLGCDEAVVRDSICTIPTSGITYEFTRMVYEILGLNISNLAGKFTAYDLLDMKDEDGKTDYQKVATLLTQNMPFSTITLHDTVSEGDERMKFDVVVGNPPYQLKDGSGGTNDAPIYQHFVESAHSLRPEFATLIMPSKWFTAGREHLLGDFRKHMLENRSIQQIVVYSDFRDLFPNVNIKGGLCYYLYNSTYSGDCLYKLVQNGQEYVSSRKLNEYDILIQNPRIANLVKKISDQAKESKGNVAEIISSDTPFGIPTNPATSKKTAFEVFEDEAEDHDTKLFYLDKAVRKTAYIRKSDITKNVQDIDKYKVFIPAAYGAGEDFPHQIVGQPEYGGKNSICSQTYLYAAFRSENEARNFITYLKTKFFRVLVLACRIEQHLPNKTYRFVPLQDFSKPWSDAELYAKYNLTDEEIAFIESMIKPME